MKKKKRRLTYTRRIQNDHCTTKKRKKSFIICFISAVLRFLGRLGLPVDRIQREPSEHENGTQPLAAGQLVAKVEDGGHDGEELAGRRHDGARQCSVVRDHPEDEKLSESARHGEGHQVPDDERVPLDEAEEFKQLASEEQSW